MTIHVNADNFARAETDRMFADIQREAGGVNTFRHNREPASIDAQTVIRLNRDTLYSFAIVDLSDGATVVVPDAGDRYLSVMIVDHDHYVRGVIHEAGEHDIVALAPDTDYVLVAARTLVDPDDPADLANVAEIQDALRLDVGSAVDFVSPEYDPGSLDATRNALLALAAGLRSFDRTFGARDEVDPVRHLIGTAAGWGGLPVSEASYVGVDPQLPVGFYDLTMHDVPVDAFWSVSVYNAAGYFEPTPEARYTVNSVTGVRDEDGAVTVHFTPPGGATEPNSIPLPEGWNYLIRLYRPRPAFADGEWHVPDLVRRRDREAEFAAANPAEAESGPEDAPVGADAAAAFVVSGDGAASVDPEATSPDASEPVDMPSVEPSDLASDEPSDAPSVGSPEAPSGDVRSDADAPPPDED
ncbi:DUF1254 domain-containing protein [Microbacterium sulfonylureivorans]|uniref:DUF1254 domain-containing protein n=1 Tax=Microbacterium sulfonylureivorans TaxID=2486854 RepID=UPI00197C49C1|nr:DUF1254 domain-containing protein [Microbacterium sulfonylureivorans]